MSLKYMPSVTFLSLKVVKRLKISITILLKSILRQLRLVLRIVAFSGWSFPANIDKVKEGSFLSEIFRNFNVQK